MAPARARLFAMAARGEPVERRVFGEGQFLRPVFIQTYRCQNVLIEGVTIVNSPMWEINPVLCRNVIVRGVTIRSHGPNNDGCDPESCRDVLIERCTFDTGDDCIALKSGRNDDGRRLHAPIENVIIRDCEMRDGHGGVVIGSEISGGARNIFAERCRMDSPRLDRVLRFKTNSLRGGVIERVAMRDITVGRGRRSDRRRRLLLRRRRRRRVHAGAPRRRHSRRDQPAEQVRVPAARLRALADLGMRATDCVFDGVESPDVLEAVRASRAHQRPRQRRAPSAVRSRSAEASRSVGRPPARLKPLAPVRLDNLLKWSYNLAVMSFDGSADQVVAHVRTLIERGALASGRSPSRRT